MASNNLWPLPATEKQTLMKRTSIYTVLGISLAVAFTSCKPKEQKQESQAPADTTFDYIADRFADVQVLRYRVDGFDELSLQQKQLAYYLYQAGLYGRDIFYDQKYRYGLPLRKTLEAILETYSGEKSGEQWDKFMVYCKRFFFANGNHHHYSSDKLIPECTQDYFADLLKKSDASKLPMEGQSLADFTGMITKLIFDSSVDPKSVDLKIGRAHV